MGATGVDEALVDRHLLEAVRIVDGELADDGGEHQRDKEPTEHEGPAPHTTPATGELSGVEVGGAP